jgi:hypothetical protein
VTLNGQELPTENPETGLKDNNSINNISQAVGLIAYLMNKEGIEEINILYTDGSFIDNEDSEDKVLSANITLGPINN